MDNNQSGEFERIMMTLCQLYRRPAPERDLLRFWWLKLVKFDLRAVSKSFDQWVDAKDYMPTPTDIITGCRWFNAPIQQDLIASAPALPHLTHDQQKINSERMRKLLSTVGKGQVDHKLWARRILASLEGRPSIAIKFAQEALNIE
jgi:hypothetical protein